MQFTVSISQKLSFVSRRLFLYNVQCAIRWTFHNVGEEEEEEEDWELRLLMRSLDFWFCMGASSSLLSIGHWALSILHILHKVLLLSVLPSFFLCCTFSINARPFLFFFFFLAVFQIVDCRYFTAIIYMLYTICISL